MVDLISIFFMILLVIGIFVMPSSIIGSIQDKLEGKLTSKQSNSSDCVDIEKLRKSIS